MNDESNVRAVAGAMAAWNAGEMETVGEMWEPDAVMSPPAGWPEPGPFEGRDAIMRQFRQMRETWSADSVEPLEGPLAAGERVMVRHRWRGLGAGPGIDMEVSVVYTFRGARIAAAEFFWDHADASEAFAAEG